MAKVLKLSTNWHGPAEPPSLKVVTADEMHGPFITTNEQRRQIQYNAQVRESIRISKLNRYSANYAIESQPFYQP